MIRKFIPLILILLALGACDIKRDNPLDPYHNHSIVKPGDVTGLHGIVRNAGTLTPYIEFHWNSNDSADTDGYYLYRSLGYYNSFAVVDTILHISGTSLQSYEHSAANDPSVAPGDYWYCISAFKDYPQGRLEGRLSSLHLVRILSQ
ncbi:MAG: hypothetical protein LHW64_05880 [Candidatus Cloacimonetes bacterium]|jgi:hypothetical protein|nr:hypothetical protein [Candidatus Cloacimonadota bacterium]MCB5287312.1 hypothetical protein [Candidatus Cloacimonadota bacterium]MCK9184647.1 hypothetical protein [Candidatus Cloacimonadota bacterium]MCK9583414.1 hypothetical protein [Candidatus Cloacimonadota bacterium]MDY0229634.1 hypothetical protein [Candidatus Cloacimonadaceae bacterium]